MKLTAPAVYELAKKCANVGENGDAIKVEGIITNYLFSKSRLEEHTDEIVGLLHELPDEFLQKYGLGWSFLQAAFDKHGNHWGEHPSMELLFALGIGVGKVEFILPREMWVNLPGGMPFVVIKD